MADWPHFRGLDRTGVSKEKGVPERLPAGGPRRLWTAKTGEGYSTISVADGVAYALGNQSGTDVLTALDATNGKVKWQYRYPCAPGDYGGPRATPAIAGGKVHWISREGMAFCLNAKDGTVAWRLALAREVRAALPSWGFASSATVVGNRVFYNVGSAGVAVDANTGRVLWSSGSGPSGYATPVPFTNAGKQALAIFAGTELVAVDPANGRRLWAFPWQTSYDVNAADPVVSGDSMFIASNYGKGGALLKLSGGQPTVVWQTRVMRNHFNACVLVDGHLFGNDEGRLRCIDWRSGAERWEMRGMGKGGVIAAGDRLIVLTERGELVLASASGTSFRELGRAQILDGTCWSQPSLSNGRLFCRNHEGTVACFALGKA